MNLPNKLTLIRVFLIPVMLIFFFIEAIPYNEVIATAVFCLAAFTDFLDGYIARKYNLITNLGKFLDPIADKILVISAFLLILDGNLFPSPYGSIGVIIIVAREFIISAFRLIAASNRTVIAADRMGKIKTICQDICIPFIMLSATFSGLAGQIIVYCGYAFFGLSVLLTVISGISCIVKNISVLKSAD